MKIRTWTSEILIFDRGVFFEELIRLIRQARLSVEIETYIFDFDQTGKRVISALTDAVSRGVRVRIVLDGLGTWSSQDQVCAALREGGVQVKLHHPFGWLGFTFSQMNKRLHRKIALFDRTTCLVGSFNITDLPHRDTAVCLQGEGCSILAAAFERLWSGGRGRGSRVVRKLAGSVRLNETKRMRRQCNAELIRRIREAQNRIWITNAYFVPPVFVFRELCMAGLRGVDVRLLLPAKSDHVFMKWLAETYYRTLLLSGVRIYEFQGAFLHAKTLLVDRWVTVGSTNFNHRSLLNDLEVDVVLEKAESEEALAQRFVSDLEHSRELELKEVRFSWIVRWIHWILLRFRFYA